MCAEASLPGLGRETSTYVWLPVESVYLLFCINVSSWFEVTAKPAEPQILRGLHPWECELNLECSRNDKTG